MNKRTFRTKQLPRGLTSNEIAKAWALLNQSLNPVGEYATWEWHRNPCQGIFLIFRVGCRPKKIRYKMFVRAARF